MVKWGGEPPGDEVTACRTAISVVASGRCAATVSSAVGALSCCCTGGAGTLATNPRQHRWQSGICVGAGSPLDWKPVWPCVAGPVAGTSGTAPRTRARAGRLKVMAASKAISRFKYPERKLLIKPLMPHTPQGFQKIHGALGLKTRPVDNILRPHSWCPDLRSRRLCAASWRDKPAATNPTLYHNVRPLTSWALPSALP